MTRASQDSKTQSLLSVRTVVLFLVVFVVLWVLTSITKTSNSEPQTNESFYSDMEPGDRLEDQKSAELHAANPTVKPKKNPRFDSRECFPGNLDFGEYPKIAKELYQDGRMIPGSDNSDDIHCVEASAWAKLMDDADAIAHARAEKRLDKVLAGVPSDDWIGKLEAVTQWVCDGSAGKSQEWDVAEEAYAANWRVSLRHDVPETLAGAVERICSGVDHYHARGGDSELGNL